MKLIAVYTTVSSLVEAQKIARSLVEQRLVACAQISEIESFYLWDDAIQNEPEFRILCKTTDDKYDAVADAIRELHTYEIPEIYTVALERVYEPYALWVENCCAPKAKK